jgi:hypothetical protein
MRPRTRFRLRYVLESRAEMNDARDLLRSITQGRRNEFWVPLWSHALHLAEPALAADTTLTITRALYMRLYGGVGYGREHLAIFPRVMGAAQTLLTRQIAESAEIDESTELLTLTAALGEDVTARDLITFLLYVRLDTDAPVLHWSSFASGILEIPVIDLPKQTPSA